jgi:hypothetical protein
MCVAGLLTGLAVRGLASGPVVEAVRERLRSSDGALSPPSIGIDGLARPGSREAPARQAAWCRGDPSIEEALRKFRRQMATDEP